LIDLFLSIASNTKPKKDYEKHDLPKAPFPITRITS
jgi:hypothetical protein